MAASLVTPPAPEAHLHHAVPRPMTRCECAGVALAEVVRHVHVEGRPLGEVLRRTGCGQNCGACLPDLEARLAAGR